MSIDTRCAVFGASDIKSLDFANNMVKVKQCINGLVDNGINTFVIGARKGYELEVALYIIELKKNNADIHLVIVRPYRERIANTRTENVVEYVSHLADMVKYISDSKDTYSSHKLNSWIVERCHTVLCISNSNKYRIQRLKNLDLSDKVVLHIPEKKEIETITREYSYLERMLADIFKLEIAEIDLSTYPEDVGERLNELCEKCLDDRSRYILNERYVECKTLKAIGEELAVSGERVRQIKNKSIRKFTTKKNRAYLTGEETEITASKRSKNQGL